MRFDDESTDTSRLQEFNRIVSQTKYGRPILPDDYAAAGSVADQLNAVVADEFSPLDNNLIAQRLAGHLVRHRLKMWPAARWIDDRFCPGYDDGDQSKLTRLYALVHNNLFAYPLASPSDYREVADDLLEYVQCCQAGVAKNCYQADYQPSELLAVKQGEYLCLFKICVPCLEALGALTPDSADYTGPPECFDTREGVPIVDMINDGKNPWSNQLSEWEPPKPPDPDDPWNA
ncbi:hypothetical protein [Mycolicibacterium porcinum]|uniref:Uncharacterized protein n=1 Tax=Mycolicibacterium porcinum TaxID=39693 RepID=A0ABV3VA84_9MYCO